LVSPITGIISHLKKVEQGVAFVYNAGHNFAFKIDSLSALKKNMRSASSGKGMTEIQAKTSALCEGIERYSGMYSGREYSVRDSYKGSLVTDKIHPNDCMLYSDKQYADRELWNSKKSRFNWVPEQFDEDSIINWTPVWSLTHKKFKYLPTQYVYYDAPLGDVSGRRLAPASSNGNATGNTFEEAILQAFFELVERDCVALWWYNRLNKPLVDIESFNDPSMMRLVDFYKSINREVWVLDLTSDLGIPCFVALSRIQDSVDEQIFFGFGCHFDARIGVSRAIAEMSQMLGIAGITGKKVPLSASVDDPETVDWFNNATLEREPYLKPSESEPIRRMGDYPKISSGNLLKDILKCNEIVSSKGMEMLVVDQTRTEAGMPAAKVIVPGLVHFWARYKPGRLYNVPVQMGWLKKPKLENEMNPTLMFI
jgi:ribosomal protein S12 methylthiotransferase accessory factor